MGLAAKITTSSIAALIAAGVALWFAFNTAPKTPPIDAPGVRAFAEPVSLADFALKDHEQRPFDNSRLKGQWTLAFFGYTHCPDICPTTLVSLDAIYDELKEIAGEPLQNTQFVFLSVDPHRDTPERLADFVTYFNPDFIGVTGKPQQLSQLTKPLGIYYEYENPKTGEHIRDTRQKPSTDDYLVHHYSGLCLFNPEGQLVAQILPPHDVERVVPIYRKLRTFYDG